MNLFFENKVALVTGAGMGMGLATAQAFAEAGAAVVLADINEQAVRTEDRCSRAVVMQPRRQLCGWSCACGRWWGYCLSEFYDDNNQR